MPSVREYKSIPIQEIRDNVNHPSFAPRVRYCFQKLDSGVRYLTDVTTGVVTGVFDHGILAGLADDDHAQYAYLAGRSSGQVLIGGTGINDDLKLRANALDGAGGHVFFNNTEGTGPIIAQGGTRFGVNLVGSSVNASVHIAGEGGAAPTLIVTPSSGGSGDAVEIFAPGGGTQTWQLTRTGLLTHKPSASGTPLTIQPFATSNVATEWRNSGGTVAARLSFTSGQARLAINKTTSASAHLDIQPTAGGNISAMRIVYTDTACANGFPNGLFNFQPTLSDATNGVPASVGFNCFLTVTNATSEYNCFEVNTYFDNEDAIVGPGVTVGRAIHFEARTTGSGSPDACYGFLGGSRHDATGTLNQASAGVYYIFTSAGAGTLASGEVIRISQNTSISSTITAYTSLRIYNPPLSGAGAITTNIALLIDSQTSGATDYAIRAEGGQSVHVGNFFFGGTTSPTAKVHLAAGTTAASTSPLKFTTGSLMTSPEDGAEEYDGAFYYKTVGTSRGAIATDSNVVVDADTGDVLTYDGDLLLAA